MSAAVDLTPDAVERGYNNRAAVPDHQRFLDEWTARSKRAQEALKPAIDVRYGSAPLETLDLYVPETPARGTLLFIHGGWWRSLDKADYAFVAPAFVAAGYAVAMVDYTLCPQAPIATIVEQCRGAVRYVAHEGPARNAPAPLVVAGHSAGGHLAAMMYTLDWRAEGFSRPPFVAGLSLSGVHDLRPLVHFSHNADFRLDRERAAALSPALLAPRTNTPLALAVGAAETSEFVRQTDLMWEAWPANRPRSMRGPMHVQGRHHYDVVLDYVDPASALSQSTLALFA